MIALETCDKCLLQWRAEENVTGCYRCKSERLTVKLETERGVNDSLHRLSEEDRLTIARLQAIVDKLPKTVDGVPATPGMELWGYHAIRGLISGRVRNDLSIIGEYNGTGYPILEFKDSYSTREAAQKP